MLKHKRFVKIVSALLAFAFIFSNLTINTNAHGLGNVDSAGTGDVGN